MIVPNSDIYLLKCPLEVDNLNQLTFSNSTTQFNYFNSLPKINLNDATYVRKNGVISWNGCIDDILTYNYCMYRNTNHNDKWFYAYILNKEYISDNCTYISITTDVWQTWQFDILYKQSFVEREHVNDDTIGANTTPEGLETGDFILNGYSVCDLFKFDNLDIVLGTSIDPINSSDNNNIMINGVYNGIATGVGYYAYRNKFNTSDNYNIDTLRENMQHLADIGSANAITTLFLAPQILTNKSDGLINNSYNNSVYIDTLPPIQDLDGYLPKNNKLYTSAYNYQRVSNGAGSSLILKPELWNNYNNKKWRIEAALTPGCSIVGYPVSYNNSTADVLNSLVLGKFPELNYSTDSFTCWQTENALNQALGIVGGVEQIVTGLATPVTSYAVEGGAVIKDQSLNTEPISNGITQIAQTLQQRRIADRVPPTYAGNTNCGDALTSGSYNTFRYENLCIRNEYARRIDNYFNMYGYNVSTLKIPNINGRSNWNYVKTILCNIEGNIPQEDLQLIKNIFNNGVTFWHNPATFLDYTKSNNIV